MKAFEGSPLRKDTVVTSKADYVTVKEMFVESDREEDRPIAPASFFYDDDSINTSPTPATSCRTTNFMFKELTISLATMTM